MDIERARFIMLDVETSGPIYGHHSLLEIGAAVGSKRDGMLGTFGALVHPISDHAKASRNTFDKARKHGKSPEIVMREFLAWCKPHLDAGARFIARPAAFDWPWIVYYAWTYLGENPFGFKAMCASTWLESHGKRFNVEIPHIAERDAEIQLQYFLDHLRSAI